MVPSRIGFQRSSFGRLVSSQLRDPPLQSNSLGRSDSVYMVPPFLAYYGVTTNNESMLQEAYTQVCFYIFPSDKP